MMVGAVMGGAAEDRRGDARWGEAEVGSDRDQCWSLRRSDGRDLS